MHGVGDGDGLWDWNLVTDRVHFSPRWVALVGAEDDEVSSSANEWLLRVHPEDAALVARELDAARSGSAQAFAFRHRLRDAGGAYRWVACRGVVVRDEAGQAIRLIGSHADVTADSVADPVTGLPDRRLFADRLARALARDSRHGHFPFAVLVLGLGRSSAQASSSITSADPLLLAAAARRLETCLRMRHERTSVAHSDFVAHLEDDHFALLLEGLNDIDDAKVVADRLVADLRSPITCNGRQVYVSACIGIAVSVTGYASPDAVLRDAETALHRARMLGGSRAEFFDTAVVRSAQTAMRVERDMQGALDRGEFAVFYQPVVSLASYAIVGFEALVRWHHPSLGLITPADFIPSAERTGFIVTLGQWVLRQACTQLSTWRATLPNANDLWMSVNLSSVQLRHPTLVGDVEALLRECHMDSRALVLELTESVACENPSAVKTLLMQLRALGVRISIDDFGTGYSSLSYLRQLPVDALKIDRSFVRGLKLRGDSAAILGTVTSMARQLGLSIVAEGVEHEADLPLLRALSCESGQGYLFARPLDVNLATTLLETGLAPPCEAEAARTAVAVEPTRAVGKGRRHFASRGRWIAVATGAVVILATAGVANRFARAPQSTAPLRVVVAPDQGRDDVGGHAVEGAATASQRAAPSRQASPSGLPPSARHSTAPVGASATRLVGGGPFPSGALPPVARKAAAPPSPIEEPHDKSFEVQHLHRFGSCVGRLVLSRSGVTFSPRDTSSKDAVTFAHGDFLSSANDDTLTVKSPTRTYRFRVRAEAGMPGPGAQLREMTEAITAGATDAARPEHERANRPLPPPDVATAPPRSGAGRSTRAPLVPR